MLSVDGTPIHELSDDSCTSVRFSRWFRACTLLRLPASSTSVTRSSVTSGVRRTHAWPARGAAPAETSSAAPGGPAAAAAAGAGKGVRVKGVLRVREAGVAAQPQPVVTMAVVGGAGGLGLGGGGGWANCCNRRIPSDPNGPRSDGGGGDGASGAEGGGGLAAGGGVSAAAAAAVTAAAAADACATIAPRLLFAGSRYGTHPVSKSSVTFTRHWGAAVGAAVGAMVETAVTTVAQRAAEALRPSRGSPTDRRAGSMVGSATDTCRGLGAR